MSKDKYSIFTLLENWQMFDKEAIILADKIKQEISKIVDESPYEDKKEAKKIFVSKVANKLTESLYEIRWVIKRRLNMGKTKRLHQLVM